MLTDLIGVIESGEPRGPTVPTNPRTTLALPFGVSLTLRVTMVYADGSPVDMNAVGVSSVWTIKRSTLDTQAVVQKVGVPVPAQGPNIVTFALLPTDFHCMQPGPYVYDVWVTLADGTRNPVIPTSRIILQPSVTLPS
jgi:hypothetical protein